MTDLQAELNNASPQERVGRAAVLGGAWFRHPSKPAVIAGSIGLLLLTFWVDWVTPPDLRPSLCYAIPALIIAWFVNRRAGYVMAVFCAVAWVSGELAAGDQYPHRIMAVWNTLLRIICLLAAVRSLSALKDLSAHLEEVVQERTRSIQLLAAQLSAAEDLERLRIAQDVHDGFSQLLTVHKLNLAAMLPIVESAAIAQRLNDALATVTDLMQRARTLTFDLHPVMLEHFGLVATLRRYAGEFSRQTSIELTVNEVGQPRALAAIAANYLFRALKELANNAVKHGQAKQIVISAYWLDGSLRLVVDDDGSGFDPHAVFAIKPPKGLGLPGIQQRVRFFGGEFCVESSVGKGTRVIVECPVRAEELTR